MRYVLFVLLFLGTAAAAQTQNYNVDLYTHPGVNPNIQYAKPIQVHQPSIIVVPRERSRTRAPRVHKSAPTASVSDYAKHPIHDQKGELFYQKINYNTEETEISTPDGKIVDYYIPVTARKWNILDASRKLRGYCVRRGFKYKIFTTAGKFIIKVDYPTYPVTSW